MLEVENIEVVYKNVITALEGVSLRVGNGEIVTLLGSNGAGKTTTLKAISGLLKSEEGKITKGNIRFDGDKIDKYEAEDIAVKGIIQVMEGRRVFKGLTVNENLLAGSFCCSDKAKEKASLEMVFRYFSRLRECIKQSGGSLSGGEQQMLVIGRALMANPKLLLLDEPSLGLAPMLVQEIFRIIKTINKEQGTSILLVEQNASLALEVGDYGHVMENGRIVMKAEASKLKDNEKVKESYIGISKFGRMGYQDIEKSRKRRRWLG